MSFQIMKFIFKKKKSYNMSK